jgi:hypothetical protein
VIACRDTSKKTQSYLEGADGNPNLKSLPVGFINPNDPAMIKASKSN